MKKQTKLEYVSPTISEIELLSGFMQEVTMSKDLPDMNVTDMDDDDFWTEN